jgi:hypothetical protein
MDMDAVSAFHRHYHDSVMTRPDLYRNSDTVITVVLPKSLLDYANAAAGHSGFGAGARPVGIRRQVQNSQRALAEIFATEQSLAKFIGESECDGAAYVAEVQRRHSEKSTPKPVMANDAKQGFWSKYTKHEMAEAIARVGKERVKELYHTATLADFERETGLAELATA